MASSKLAEVSAAKALKLMESYPKVDVSHLDDDNEDKKSRSSSVSSAICTLCEKSFTTAYSLRKHIIKVHKISNVDFQTYDGSIKCGFYQQCKAAFDSSVFYRKHLQKIHKVDLGKKVLCFETEDDFLSWKSKEQQQTQSRFNRHYKATFQQTNVDMKKESYLCSCSDRKPKNRVSKRSTKKINCKCPARMDVVIGKEGVFVSYFSTHVGHDVEPLDVFKKKEKRKKLIALRKARLNYEAMKNEAKDVCSELMLMIDDGIFTIDFLKVIVEKLSDLLIPDPNHLLFSSSLEETSSAILPVNGNDNLEQSDMDVSESITGSPTNSNKLSKLDEKASSMMKSNAKTDKQNTMNVEGSGTVSTSAIKDKVEKPFCSTKDLDFKTENCPTPCATQGKIKIISHTNTSGEKEDVFMRRVRSSGFLHSPDTLNPTVVLEFLKQEETLPKPASEETKLFYENLWNKYRESLSVPKPSGSKSQS